MQRWKWKDFFFGTNLSVPVKTAVPTGVAVGVGAETEMPVVTGYMQEDLATFWSLGLAVENDYDPASENILTQDATTEFIFSEWGERNICCHCLQGYGFERANLEYCSIGLKVNNILSILCFFAFLHQGHSASRNQQKDSVKRYLVPFFVLWLVVWFEGWQKGPIHECWWLRLRNVAFIMYGIIPFDYYRQNSTFYASWCCCEPDKQ